MMRHAPVRRRVCGFHQLHVRHAAVGARQYLLGGLRAAGGEHRLGACCSARVNGTAGKQIGIVRPALRRFGELEVVCERTVASLIDAVWRLEEDRVGNCVDDRAQQRSLVDQALVDGRVDGDDQAGDVARPAVGTQRDGAAIAHPDFARIGRTHEPGIDGEPATPGHDIADRRAHARQVVGVNPVVE